MRETSSRVVAMGAALLVSLAGIGAIERNRGPADELDANAPGSDVAFSHAPRARDGDGRRLDGSSEIVLRGLGSRCATEVGLTLSARTPRRAIVIEKLTPTQSRRLADVIIGPTDQRVVAQAESDRWGALRLLVRFDSDTTGATVRILRIDVNQDLERLARHRTLEVVLLMVAVALAAPGSLAIRALAGGLAAAVALLGPPLVVHGHLPTAWRVTTAVIAWRYGARVLERCLKGLQPRWASCIALGAVMKIWVAMVPGVVSLDAYFHAHNVFEFGRGAMMTSLAPGPREAMAVPYPPAVYAILWPGALIFGLDEHDMATVVRLSLGILEGLIAPLLLWALLRRDPEVAGPATAIFAAMPEGLLVVAKGILANAFGQSATLAVIWALTRAVRPSIAVGLLAIALMSHLSAAACLVSLLILWWGWEWYRLRDGATLRRRLWCLLAATAIAFVLYYRELVGVTVEAALKVGHQGALRMNWILLGKLMQSLWLKYGAAPLLLAVLGIAELRRRNHEDRFLWYAWVATFLGMAVLGATTLFMFRFDYFATPLVAVLAAYGGVSSRGRRWVGPMLAFTFGTQALIALFLLTGRFEILSVLLYSPRWPFPFRLS